MFMRVRPIRIIDTFLGTFHVKFIAKSKGQSYFF